MTNGSRRSPTSGREYANLEPCGYCKHLEHLECDLQPLLPGCFTKKLGEARDNGIGGFVAAAR